MNTWAHIFSGLKGTLATPWRSFASVPALILFWLQLRRLTTALDTLFTAWRDGTLPPPPAAPAARPASNQDAPRPRTPSSRPKSAPRARQPRAAAPRRERRAPRAPAPMPHPVTLPLLLRAPVTTRATFPRPRKRRRRKAAERSRKPALKTLRKQNKNSFRSLLSVRGSDLEQDTECVSA